MSKKSTSNCEKINSSFQQDPGTAHMYRPIYDNWGTNMRKVAGMADVSVLKYCKAGVKSDSAVL